MQCGWRIAGFSWAYVIKEVIVTNGEHIIDLFLVITVLLHVFWNVLRVRQSLHVIILLTQIWEIWVECSNTLPPNCFLWNKVKRFLMIFVVVIIFIFNFYDSMIPLLLLLSHHLIIINRERIMMIIARRISDWWILIDNVITIINIIILLAIVVICIKVAIIIVIRIELQRVLKLVIIDSLVCIILSWAFLSRYKIII